MKANVIGVIALSIVGLFLVAVLVGFVIGQTSSIRSSQTTPAVTVPGGGGTASPTLPEGGPPGAQGPGVPSPGSPQTGQEPLGGAQGASSGQTAPQAPLAPVSPTAPPGVAPTILPPPPAAPAAPPSQTPAPAVPPGPSPPAAVPPPFVVSPATGGNPAFATGGNRFHVQVGAFDERQNAEALRLRIRSLGYAVTVTDGPPYRVWVGAYLDRATAERLIENLRAAGFDAILSP